MDSDQPDLLSNDFLEEYRKQITFDLDAAFLRAQQFDMPVDYFTFYKSMSSVYSSKIEGENIDFDSFFKHKFLKVKYKLDYTRRADDLFEGYQFIEEKPINLKNLTAAHSIITRNLLPKSQRGLIRTNPMLVLNNEDKIEYVAAESHVLQKELKRFFAEIKLLSDREMDTSETFYFASLIHLVFVKIHPFQDGNGRAGRLLEKWFLVEKLGPKAIGIQLEKNYFRNLKSYYVNLKVLGAEYEHLDYRKGLDFLLMTPFGLKEQTAK